MEHKEDMIENKQFIPFVLFDILAWLIGLVILYIRPADITLLFFGAGILASAIMLTIGLFLLYFVNNMIRKKLPSKKIIKTVVVCNEKL